MSNADIGELKLIFPCEEYMSEYIAAYNEDVSFRAGEEEFFCPPDIVISQAERYRAGTDLPPGHIPSTMLWGVEGKRFIGCVDIRHTLTPKLMSYGGHIGYEVRYSLWNRGYGTRLLALALRYARDSLGITRALVTCAEDNIPSSRVIEHNGGVYENTVDNGGRPTKRYWIDIK